MSYSLADNNLPQYLADTDNMVRSIYRATSSIRSSSAGGTLTSQHIRDYCAFLDNARTYLNKVVTHPNIAALVAYAKTARNDNTFDLQAELNAILAGVGGTIQSVFAWISSHVPKNAQGYWLDTQDDGISKLTPRAYDAATTATFRTELDGLLARILV